VDKTIRRVPGKQSRSVATLR